MGTKKITIYPEHIEKKEKVELFQQQINGKIIS
jgi:hypothetical protein